MLSILPRVSSCISLPVSSGGGHGGEFPIRERLCVHGGRPDPAVRQRETPGQRHQSHQRGEEERQRQGREGEEEAGGREGERQGKSQEGHAERTRGHVQVRL